MIECFVVIEDSDMSMLGLESKTEEVWRWVIDECVGMIGIHGVGGVGKTTLLKQIYNKLTIYPHSFDMVIWVTVSRSLSLEKVQDDIWKRIGVFNAEWVDRSSEAKAEAIHDVLSNTEFVLLLDDLGEPLDLRKVGVVEPLEEDESNQMVQVRFPDPGNNCKVIFTTRAEEVCRHMGAQATMEIQSLEWGHAWELFKEMVGEDKFCDPQVREVAQVIARTCQGLPMLLRGVGRAMASKTTFEEWKAAMKGLQFQVDKYGEKMVAPSLLKLCFQSLDQRTRSCLLCYCLFPEDFTIRKNELIDFWIYQQLLGDGIFEEYGEVLNVGYKTVDALLGACLLEEEDSSSVKLLDMVRDCGLESGILDNDPFFSCRNMEVGWLLPMRDSISNSSWESLFPFLLNHNPFVMIDGYSYLANWDEERDEMNSIFVESPSLLHLSRPPSPVKILTNRDEERTGLSVFGELLSHLDSPKAPIPMKNIKVLDLSNSGVEQIPRDIADLVFLEYLNLSYTWIELLPVEIKKLVNLNCLNLEYNELLRVVPKQLIDGLLNLEVLKLFRCGFSVEEVKDNMLSAKHMDITPVLGLPHLKVLSITITSLSALQQLLSNHQLLSITQSLSLEVFWGVRYLDIFAVATMKNLVTLEIRQVEDLKEVNDFSHCIELVQAKGFEKLREITLVKCSSLTELTWVVLVPNLTVLAVKDCGEIKEIVSMRRLKEMLNKQDVEPFMKL